MLVIEIVGGSRLERLAIELAGQTVIIFQAVITVDRALDALLPVVEGCGDGLGPLRVEPFCAVHALEFDGAGSDGLLGKDPHALATIRNGLVFWSEICAFPAGGAGL